jgi:hypothetical protein
MVDMVQSAKNGVRHDIPAFRVAHWFCCCAWGALTDRAMRAPPIEILHVLRQHRTQMPLIENEHVIQAFGPVPIGNLIRAGSRGRMR